jgi:hypothetical protein
MFEQASRVLQQQQQQQQQRGQWPQEPQQSQPQIALHALQPLQGLSLPGVHPGQQPLEVGEGGKEPLVRHGARMCVFLRL